MIKVKQILAAAALVLAPFATVGVASADSCTIEGFEGPNSDNLCVSIETYTCTVNNDNTVTIDQTNDQVSVTGDATTGGNTGGGGAQSGSSTNDNNVTFDVTVENEGVCQVVATVPATPDAPAKETKEEVTPEETEEPVVLAETAGDSTAVVLAVLGAAAVVTLAGAQLVTRLAKR